MSLPERDREEDGARDPGMTALSLLGRPESSPLPGNVQSQGTGANLARFWEHRQPQPGFPKPPSRVTRTETDDRYRGEDTGSGWESEPWDVEGLWTHHMLPGRVEAWQPSPELTCFPVTQEATDGRSCEEKGHWQKKRWVTAPPGAPSSSPCPPSPVQPRRVTRPQTIETTSSVPQEDLDMCV